MTNNLTSLNKPTIRIDVVSDIVCPWCYIGKRRLEKAIGQLSPTIDVQVAYLPFELNPDMPAEGKPQKEYLVAKFGGEERYDQLTGNVTRIASQEGLTFNYAKQTVSPNTLDAHRLLWFARDSGRQGELKEALMNAYFQEGIDLSNRSNLVAVAVQAGFDEPSVSAFLNSEDGIAEVRYAEEINYQRGISGVPFFIINNKYGISGAQPTEAFVKALTQIGSEMSAAGQVCSTDGC